jgi:hypothetical protein
MSKNLKNFSFYEIFTLFSRILVDFILKLLHLKTSYYSFSLFTKKERGNNSGVF